MIKLKRCKNGTRRNKITKQCEPRAVPAKITVTAKRIKKVILIKIQPGQNVKPLGKFLTPELEQNNSAITKIAEGQNGVVFKITYGNGNSNSNRIHEQISMIKSAKNNTTDNLFYECYVGAHFINNVLKTLPNFVHTYGIYASSSENSAIENYYSIKNISWASSCKQCANMHLHIQYVPDSISFGDYLQMKRKNIDPYVVLTNLYQVYFSLASLGENFTHYDLHSGNVLLQQLQKKIIVQYVQGNATTRFKTSHICKIIDYGRSYANFARFNVDAAFATTADIVAQICESKICTNPKDKTNVCGKNAGYGNIARQTDAHFMTSMVPNISMDLRLASQIIKVTNKYVPDFFGDVKIICGAVGTK